MTVSESLRAKVRAGLLRPTADGLDRALDQLVSIRDGLKVEACSPAEALTIRKELAGIELLARQIQQLYAAFLSIGSKKDDAAANYTQTGQFVAGPGEPQPAILRVIHG